IPTSSVTDVVGRNGQGPVLLADPHEHPPGREELDFDLPKDFVRLGSEDGPDGLHFLEPLEVVDERVIPEPDDPGDPDGRKLHLVGRHVFPPAPARIRKPRRLWDFGSRVRYAAAIFPSGPMM